MKKMGMKKINTVKSMKPKSEDKPMKLVQMMPESSVTPIAREEYLGQRGGEQKVDYDGAVLGMKSRPLKKKASKF